MSRTLDGRKTDKPSRNRLPLVIMALVVIAGLATWLIINSLGAPNPLMQGDGNGTDGQVAIAAGESQDQAPVEPITTFEGAMSGEWPEAEESVGCTYVVERLTAISQEVHSEGVTAMRSWLGALDDLQGDPAVADATAQFDTVKRTWSTVLAADANKEQSSSDELNTAEESLEELIANIDCN